MSWYPGKYAAKAIASAGRVAQKAANVAQTAATKGAQAAVEQAKQQVGPLIDQAESDFEDAQNEVLEALKDPANQKMFQTKAEDAASKNASLIRVLATASSQLSKDGYVELSKQLLTPSSVTSTSQASAGLKAYAGSTLTQAGPLPPAFPVASIGNQVAAAAGLGIEVAGLVNPVFPILRFVLSDFVPYPYREASVDIGAQLTAEAGLSVGAFAGKANEQWGFFVVASVFADYELGAGVNVYFRMPDADLDGLEVTANAATGLPLGTKVGVGRTFSLPVLYLVGGYSQSVAS